MNQFFGFAAKNRNSLSASSVEAILSCPSQFFFESILDLGFKFPLHPASVYGQVIHYVNEQLLLRMWKDGPLPLSDKDRTVKAWTNFLWAVYLGTEVLPNRSPQSIRWLTEREQLLDKKKQDKIVSERMASYVRKGATAIEAMYYLCTKHATAFEMIPEYRFDIMLDSTITPGKQFKVMGFMDLLSRYPSGRVTVIDWKTGRRSAFTLQKIMQHTQMLLYSYVVKQRFGVVPNTYIVSQDLYPKDLSDLGDDLEKKQNLLMSDPFLIRVPMQNYEQQEPELLELFSEVWYVLSNLISPPKTVVDQKVLDEWQPKTAVGRLVNLQENLRQRRPLPVISPACDYCNAKAMCMQCNQADWEHHFHQQGFAKLSRDGASAKATAEAVAIQLAKVPVGVNYSLFEGAPQKHLGKAWKRATAKLNWIKLGFVKVKSSSTKLVRDLWKLIPRHTSGQLCPCVEGKWLWSNIVNHSQQVDEERQKHKQLLLKNRQRDSSGKLIPIKPFRKSFVVGQLIESCPVGSCPHRKN